MTSARLQQTVSTAALLTAALAITPAQAQIQAQSGSAHDSNQQVGSGGYNQPGQQIDYRARNLLITGNVAGGRGFQGAINYSADGAFQGGLGSDSLFNFRAESVFSAPRAGGLNTLRASQAGNQVIVSRPSDNLTGFRGRTGNGLATRTSYDPGSGVVTFRQNGGGLVSIAGLQNVDSLRNAGSAIGLVNTPSGLVSVNASPLTGIRYNPLDVNGATQRRSQPDTPTPPDFDQGDNPTQPDTSTNTSDPLTLRQNLRFDGTNRSDLTQEQLTDLNLRKDPLAITLGTQVQSQLALQLAGQDGNNLSNSQAESLRERVFGKPKTADTAEPPKAPENPYDKLIADILANAQGPDADPDAGDQAEEEGSRPAWQKIFDQPDQKVREAKLEAREVALRLSLDMVDEDGNIDYETELPTIDPTSDLGKLLEDLSYDLPRVRTLAGEDPNRINKLLSRGEQEIEAERYIIAENVYRQVLREKKDDPLAMAGLIHSQMGAGMIRSSAFNLRDLFANNPELIALQYDDKLLPQTDRLRWLQGRLQKMIGEDIHGADPGLILAYLGYQLEAKPLIEFGLNVAESEAPRDPLMPLLRKIWIEGEDAENADEGNAEDPNK